jgi:hypothetical protein
MKGEKIKLEVGTGREGKARRKISAKAAFLEKRMRSSFFSWP